jgi:preprotein translocase subunit SecG
MQTILIVFHIIVSVLLVSVILFQSNGSDELKGIGGGSSGLDGVMSSAASASFVTKLTSILAAIFMINCLVLANISSRESDSSLAGKVMSEQTRGGSKDRSLPMAE